MTAALAFATNRWAQLLIAVILAGLWGFAEGHRQADRSAEIKAQNAKIERLEAEGRVAEWARKTSLAVSQRIDEASKREIENRQTAEAETRDAVLDSDAWEQKFNEEKARADRALQTASDAVARAEGKVAISEAIQCPDYRYSDTELRRLQQRAKRRPVGASNPPHSPANP